jgi:hypothetical protein
MEELKNIWIASTGSRGDVQPYTAVGDALIVGDILYGSTQMKNMFP